MSDPMLPVGHAQTVVATVSGEDLLKSLNALTVQVTEVKTIVQDLPGQITEQGKRLNRLEIWKAKITGAVALISVLLTGGTVTALVTVFIHVKGQ